MTQGTEVSLERLRIYLLGGLAVGAAKDSPCVGAVERGLAELLEWDRVIGGRVGVSRAGRREGCPASEAGWGTASHAALRSREARDHIVVDGPLLPQRLSGGQRLQPPRGVRAREVHAAERERGNQ